MSVSGQFSSSLDAAASSLSVSSEKILAISGMQLLLSSYWSTLLVCLRIQEYTFSLLRDRNRRSCDLPSLFFTTLRVAAAESRSSGALAMVWLFL